MYSTSVHSLRLPQQENAHRAHDSHAVASRPLQNRYTALGSQRPLRQWREACIRSRALEFTASPSAQSGAITAPISLFPLCVQLPLDPLCQKHLH